MDFLKPYLDRISRQLSALTPSQRMLTAALVAIMVMTLVWWGRYAGDPEMEPLLPQAISQEELPRVEMELDARGIKHAMAGDKLLVPADRRVEAVAGLMYSHALPRNARDGFDEVLKNINPFMPESQTSKMWNRGKELTVSRIISDFPDVADAHVAIDPTREVRIGGGIEPSASVTITMRDGAKASQQLIDAAADVVEGAQASLPRNKIRVVVNGLPRHVSQASPNGSMFAFPDDQQEAIAKAEMRYEERVKNQLAYIPNLMVSVTVTLNTAQVTEDSKTYDAKNAVSKETEIHTKTSENATDKSAGGEPGIGANTGLSVTGGAAAAGGNTSTQEENTTKLQNFVPETETHRAMPGGDSTAVAAAVRVPLTYFAAIYERQNPGVKDPTEKQLRALIDDELPRIRRDVMKITFLKSESDVAVETYVDPLLQTAPPQTVTAGFSAALLTGTHIKDVVLGVLALVSLFMVSMVVRRSGPAVATASAAPTNAATPELDAGGDLAGEVSAVSNALDGMELDEEALRAQQMLEQVSSLVKENPDGAASLVKRWMSRS